MKVYLIVAKGKHQGMPILIKGDLFLMGSDKVCQLRSSLPGVGEQHCAIVTRDEKVFIRDLDSSQSTVVNGEGLQAGQEWPLHAGDRLNVGPLEFMVQFQEKPLSRRDAEEWALKTLDDASKDKRTHEGEDLYKGGRVDTASQAAASILGKLDSQRGEVKGRLRIFSEGDTTIVRINEQNILDEAEIALMKKELTEQLANISQRVLIDFKNVRRLSSMGIAMFIGLYRQLKARGVSLGVCQVSPDVMPILEVVGMNKLVRCFPDKDGALSAKW